MTGFLGALALTIGCVGIVMLAAIAANRLFEHQEARDAERHRQRGEGRLFTTPWDGDDPK